MSPSKARPQFESWGRFPKLFAEVRPLFWKEDFPSSIASDTKILAVGMGRSYGDVCLLKDGNLLLTTAMNRLIEFDPETGLLTDLAPESDLVSASPSFTRTTP